MANIPGRQPEVMYCPHCKSDLINVKREDMKSKYRGKDVATSKYTHTYQCQKCQKRFEINQDRDKDATYI